MEILETHTLTKPLVGLQVAFKAAEQDLITLDTITAGVVLWVITVGVNMLVLLNL
jgi:hypothetical protein